VHQSVRVPGGAAAKVMLVNCAWTHHAARLHIRYVNLFFPNIPAGGVFTQSKHHRYAQQANP